MLGAVETMRLGFTWAESRDVNAATATLNRKLRRVSKERRELSLIEPKVGRKVSVLRRKLQFEPLAGLLAQRRYLRIRRYPSPVGTPSGTSSGSSLFTVAGPRRFYTGLPF